MTQFICLSCGGKYNDAQPGGYYHACPADIKNPRDENLDPAAELVKFVSAQGEGYEKTYQLKHAGLGRVEVTEQA